jgi:Uma2 family endonuclease
MVAQNVYIAPDEYLRMERDAPHKSEFIDGEIIEMAGGTTNHNLIKENVAIQVGMHVRTNGKGCRSMSSDQRVYVPTPSLYAYPDVVVVCGANQYHDALNDTLINFMLVVEVLSAGTAAYDRGDKFAHYRHTDTFREYLIVDSEKVRAEVYRKHTEGFWFLASEADNASQSVYLATLDLTLPMTAIYAETEGILAAKV